MDFYTWTHQYWLTNKNLEQFCEDIGCSLEELQVAMDLWMNGEKVGGRLESLEWHLMELERPFGKPNGQDSFVV